MTNSTTAFKDKNFDFKESKDGNQMFKDNAIIKSLERAMRAQSNDNKERMRVYLDSIKPDINLSIESRASFMYFLVNSRNLLYYHHYEESTIQADKAWHMKKYSSKEESIYILTTIGNCHYYKSDYEKALKSHFQALQLCESSQPITCFSNIFNNISVVFMGTGDWDKAELYVKKALEISERNDNGTENSRAVGNMAIVYAEKGQFKTSEEWFKKDLRLDLANGDSLSAARNLNNLGRLNDIQQQYGKALQYYEDGLELAREQKDAASEALGYQNVGWMQHKLGKNDSAILNFKKGMQMTKDLGNRDKLRDAYLNISEFYEATGNEKKALDFFAKYHELNDSLVGAQNLNAVSEIEIKYETEKKENKILKLSEEQLKSELTIASQNRSVRWLTIGLTALVFFFGLSFILYKQWSRNKKQNELLLAISETQIAERKRIAQDLHDGIGGSLALTKNKLSTLSDTFEAKPKAMQEAIEAVTQTSNQVRQIAHNLMPGELVRFGLVPAIGTLLEQLNENELNAQLYTTQMEKRLEPLKEIQLYRIIQEALQNVLKHAKANNIAIHLHRHKQHLSLMIEDDGQGFVPNRTDGLGLKNIEQRTKILKGTFRIDSLETKGTTLNIQIPI